MKIVMPGGTGQVGAVLAQRFHYDGHEVVVIGRNPRKADWKTVQWDATTLGAWATELDGADVVINLAGRSVNCRYTAKNRGLIKQSRVVTTRLVGEAIAATQRPPRVWLQSSTATIYAHRFDAPNDEATGIIGGNEPDVPDTWRFSIDVAKAWELELDHAVVPETRKIKMRSAMIMSPDRGGIFDTMLTLVRRDLGGTAGNGQQYISWIRDVDFIRAVYWMIAQTDVVGVINIAAPNPVPNASFMRDFRAAWGMPIGLPATKWMLKMGAIFMRAETELILKSRRVVPGILQSGGFTFQFPTWPEAVKDLCNQWRKEHASGP